MRLSIGYCYTFVLKEHLFFNANIAPSVGVRFSKLSETVEAVRQEVSNTSFTRALEGGAQLGYASRRIVFGLGFAFDVNGYNEDKFNAVANNKFYGNIYFGYRLNTTGFIDRTYNKYAKNWVLINS
ncbi:DUF4421 family protein [Robiginitalea aurantiaca]|uniref:DUF4421 family protein n=1 Tax=Robiginitalea aurantiaca TaxID=3056915 RepID=A0ABT7WIG6_9FLAO|nr:DUF4421 family protein [Robiginitalea aurantiaca]MDM9632717.1 DUF4421 family protein [Robiginitalea aurantiaca]